MEALKNNITHEQRKKIFALSSQAHLSNEELHHYIYDWAKVSSLSTGSCNNSQANKIIDALQNIVNIRKTPISASPEKGGATEKQIHAINTIQKILKWHDGRLNGFIGHTVGKSDINDLTVVEASKVITGLRNMLPKKFDANDR